MREIYIKQYIYTFIDQKKKSLLKLEKEKKNIPQIHKTPYTIIDQQQNRSMVPWL